MSGLNSETKRILRILIFLILIAVITAGTVFISAQTHSRTAQENTMNITKLNERKILIAYFSLIDIVPENADAVSHATPAVGNTESAAMQIQSITGGDLFAIKTSRQYPVSHREASSIAGNEMRRNDRPPVTSHVENMAQYDIVFIGYPIWWYVEPMVVRTFIEEYDFTGKTIVPFCTSMGAGVERSVESIKQLAGTATVQKGITLSTGRADFSRQIADWLDDIGIAQ